MSRFEQKKQKILADLAVPPENYNDASPKGTVDEGIRDFVDEINQLDDYVTTSSCAGRVAVYQEGSAASDIVDRTSALLKTGSKGGGRWLFVSHHPLPLDSGQRDEDCVKLMNLAPGYSTEATQSTGDVFVHLKFEPMILHVLCSSVPSASRLLSAAMVAGFRESGISSITDDRSLVMVAIRTAGLAFDSIIALAQPDETPRLIVSPAYIRMLLQVANARFLVNADRTHRFRTALQEQVAADQDPVWEPADVRKARKRAEGLQRQQMKAEPSQGDQFDLAEDSLYFEIG